MAVTFARKRGRKQEPGSMLVMVDGTFPFILRSDGKIQQ
jgi:hypothetical protein